MKNKNEKILIIGTGHNGELFNKLCNSEENIEKIIEINKITDIKIKIQNENDKKSKFKVKNKKRYTFKNDKRNDFIK